MIFFFILITYLVAIILKLCGEIISWSLTRVKGLREKKKANVLISSNNRRFSYQIFFIPSHFFLFLFLFCFLLGWNSNQSISNCKSSLQHENILRWHQEKVYVLYPFLKLLSEKYSCVKMVVHLFGKSPCSFLFRCF